MAEVIGIYSYVLGVPTCLIPTDGDQQGLKGEVMVPVVFANIFCHDLTIIKPVILPSYRVSLLCTVVNPKKKNGTHFCPLRSETAASASEVVANLM